MKVKCPYCGFLIKTRIVARRINPAWVRCPKCKGLFQVEGKPTYKLVAKV
jgi:uncharacterized C2H2 Zn-finger protein